MEVSKWFSWQKNSSGVLLDIKFGVSNKQLKLTLYKSLVILRCDRLDAGQSASMSPVYL